MDTPTGESHQEIVGVQPEATDERWDGEQAKHHA